MEFGTVKFIIGLNDHIGIFQHKSDTMILK